MDSEEISANFYKSLTVTLGQRVELDCKSDGGNPITSLGFTKNGTSFGVDGPQCKCLNNTHTFVVTESDHAAVLGCRAQNKDKWQADSQTVELNVLCKLHDNIHGFYLLKGCICIMFDKEIFQFQDSLSVATNP